jgi:hypothetical protein
VLGVDVVQELALKKAQKFWGQWPLLRLLQIFDVGKLAIFSKAIVIITFYI